MNLFSASSLIRHALYRILYTFPLILYTLYSILYTAPSAHAATDPIDQLAPVTATIPATPTSSTNLPPSAPILLRPSDGAITADNTPELVWRGSTDPDGNTIYYDLYLDGIATYLGISNDGSSASTGYTSTIDGNEVRLIPTTSLSDGSYNWLVRAYDVNEEYTNSTTWGFTIDTTPPDFTITAIDIHHNLTLNSADPSSVPEDTTFEVTGPKDIYFTITTEPYTTIQLAFYNQAGELVTQTSATTSSLSPYVLYPYVHLSPGTYSVQALAIDRANLTTLLPTFELIVKEAAITLPVPPIPGLPPSYSIPYTPHAIPSFPATIARISSRYSIAIIVVGLLAIGLYILLALLKKRRYNLVLINDQGTPLTQATIYHSKPDTKHSHTPVLLTRREPFRFPLTSDDHGKVYIPRLNRYSTLTIRTADSLTIISIASYHSPMTYIIS